MNIAKEKNEYVKFIWIVISMFAKLQHVQGHGQNLKEVPQRSTEVFNIDDIIANEVMQRNKHREEKKNNLNCIVITDVKSAS